MKRLAKVIAALTIVFTGCATTSDRTATIDGKISDAYIRKLIVDKYNVDYEHDEMMVMEYGNENGFNVFVYCVKGRVIEVRTDRNFRIWVVELDKTCSRVDVE